MLGPSRRAPAVLPKEDRLCTAGAPAVPRDVRYRRTNCCTARNEAMLARGDAMPGKLVLGLDLGGGGVRCLALDAVTGARFTATRTWSFAVAEGTFGLGYELDLSTMRSLVGQA